ncbi:MAG: hypothetical protein HY861_02285 [Chlamydiia bacterium]|nr:hypothetical protein [Chlamydiia bacterium]
MRRVGDVSGSYESHSPRKPIDPSRELLTTADEVESLGTGVMRHPVSKYGQWRSTEAHSYVWQSRKTLSPIERRVSSLSARVLPHLA